MEKQEVPPGSEPQVELSKHRLGETSVIQWSNPVPYGVRCRGKHVACQGVRRGLACWDYRSGVLRMVGNCFVTFSSSFRQGCCTSRATVWHKRCNTQE